MSGFKRNLPPVEVPANVVPGMKATFIHYGDKHQWKQLGVVVVHDAQTKTTLHEFDFRYRGKKSRLGRYLRDLHAKGVDVTGVVSILEPLEKEKEDLALSMAKRLYEALVKRTISKRVDCVCGVKAPLSPRRPRPGIGSTQASSTRNTTRWQYVSSMRMTRLLLFASSTQSPAMLEYAKICHFSNKEMAKRGYPTAPSGWYLQVKYGPVIGYLRIALDGLEALPSLLPKQSWRVRSRHARR